MKKLLSLLLISPLAITACGELPVVEDDREDATEIGGAVTPFDTGRAYGSTSGDKLAKYSKQAGYRDEAGTLKHYILKDNLQFESDLNKDNCAMINNETNHLRVAMTIFTEISHPVGNGYAYSGSGSGLELWPGYTSYCNVPDYRWVYIDPTNNTEVSTEITVADVSINTDDTVREVWLDETISSESSPINTANFNTSINDYHAFDLIDNNEAKDTLTDKSGSYSWKNTLSSTDQNWVDAIDLIKASFIGLTLAEATAMVNDSNWIPDGIGTDEGDVADIDNRYQYAETILKAIENANA